MANLPRHKWWLLTALLLTVPVWAVAQTLTTTFTSGTVISATAVSNNFQNLDNRLKVLEAATAVPRSAIRITTDADCTAAVDQTDCACHADEIPIGGGAFANGLLSINATQYGGTFWRIACTSATARTLCNSPFAVCLKVK